jgi:hypothetical protein
MTTDTVGRTERRLSPALLVGGAFALSTLLSITMHVGEIVFTDHDPHAPEGPIASTASVSVVGGAALVLALAIAVPLAGDSRRARIGAVVLGLLTVVSLVVFWSGAPATLGAAAAWLGGLAKGSHPQTGIARGFGIFGMVIAILIIVATMFGGIASAVLN